MNWPDWKLMARVEWILFLSVGFGGCETVTTVAAKQMIAFRFVSLSTFGDTRSDRELIPNFAAAGKSEFTNRAIFGCSCD